MHIVLLCPYEEGSGKHGKHTLVCAFAQLRVCEWSKPAWLVLTGKARFLLNPLPTNDVYMSHGWIHFLHMNLYGCFNTGH